MPACERCGQDNPAIARFCLACGAPLAGAAERRDVRKTVTVVFADLTGSTALGERLDPESLRRVLSRCFDDLEAVVERHGGTVEKFIGDAIMAVFGVPVVHEDDALRAVRAAAGMRDRAVHLAADIEAELGARVDFRIGVNTGEVVAGEGVGDQRLATGDAVNVAARLEQAAAPGEVLIGRGTRDLVRDAIECERVEPLQLKGKSEPVEAFRLLAVRPDELGRARRFDSPLVGREHERRVLEESLRRATRERTCHLFTLLGPAGVGKSRLVLEFLRTLGDDVQVVHGRCLPYGDGITYWPLAEALGEAAELQTTDTREETLGKLGRLVEGEPDRERVAARVAGALGVLDPGGSREEIFWGVRKLLEACARRRPLVVVFDDLHWAEPTFLDLVEHLADWSRDAPILVLCISRPELLDARPHWGGGKLNATTVLLEALSDAESAVLIENLLGRAELDEHARTRITSAAEGNPLFVEEMLAMLIDEGLLAPTDGGWAPVQDLATVRIPPTIQALLAARLDRLNGDERAAIERAAVEGKVFHLGAVAELSAAAGRDAVGASVLSLVRKELVRPDHPQLAGEDAFRFRHLLIRDAAYDSISKELRAELHERFAAWLEGRSPGAVGELDELVGYHLEQATRYREQLGQRDERTTTLARRAAERLERAADRVVLHDPAAFVSLLSRVTDLLPPDDRGRIAALVDLGDALVRQFQLERAAAAADEAARRARALGDRRLELQAEVVRGFLRMSTDPEGATEAIFAVVQEALPVFEAAGDDRGLALAWTGMQHVHHVASRFADAAAAGERALECAERAGPRVTRGHGLPSQLAVPVGLGPMPVESGLARLESLQAAAGNSVIADIVCGSMAGLLEAYRGNIDEARELNRTARTAAEELGVPFALLTVSEWACVGELAAGDPAVAEREMRRGYEMLEQAGEKTYLSTMACHLAEALERQGDDTEAYRLTEVAEELGAADDAVTQMEWRRVRALVHLRRGEVEQATELARASVELAERTDALAWQGQAWLALALALRAAGDVDAAAEALGHARERFERKGATALLQRADDLFAGRAG